MKFKKKIVVILLLSCFVKPTHINIYIYIYIQSHNLSTREKRKEGGIDCKKYLSQSTKDLHYFIDKNVSSNYIFSFFPFFLFHYNHVILHRHTGKGNEIHQQQKRED